MPASPIPSIRSGTMRESGTAAHPYVHTHPIGFQDAERAGGGKGESQPRRPAQEQQVVARRRRTAHPTVMPCHDYVHVERIKRSCCKLHRAPGTTQLHGNQPANTNLWVSTVLQGRGNRTIIHHHLPQLSPEPTATQAQQPGTQGLPEPENESSPRQNPKTERRINQ